LVVNWIAVGVPKHNQLKRLILHLYRGQLFEQIGRGAEARLKAAMTGRRLLMLDNSFGCELIDCRNDASVGIGRPVVSLVLGIEVVATRVGNEALAGGQNLGDNLRSGLHGLRA
jgi:hypothetical protein